MFLPISDMKSALKSRIAMLNKQGFDTAKWSEQLDTTADSYDAVYDFAKSMNSTIKYRADFPYSEPDGIEEIRRARPDNRRDVINGYISDIEVKDKTYGGVIGRMLGCVLGKPLEVSWDLPRIRAYLEGADAWPLCDFVPAHSTANVGQLRRDCADSMKGFVRHVQQDDDINYLVLGLNLLEYYGCGFTTQDSGKNWVNNIPFHWTWGPEHTVYGQLAQYLVINHNRPLPEGAAWDEFRDFINSGEEIIGAMIRGDAFGLVNPGRTALAAEMAWRDGILTHKKTGLYSEMWVAASIAAAYYERDPVKVVQAGIDQLPANSRYAECLREALQISIEAADWYSAWEKINAKWGHLGHAGTMNESAGIINALINSTDRYFNVDFEKVICTTVMQGWDTDCSGATAGCIAGVMCGLDGIPEKWSSKLNDKFYSCVAGERESSIAKFSERMYQMIRITREYAANQR